MNTRHLVALYVVFAGLSILANLGSQWLSTKLYGGPYHIMLSMLVGTAVGLITKYALDKRWIFRFQAASTFHEVRTFILYTVMGGATTLIFWGTEGLFQLAFGTEVMRYVGALIGLTLGYLLKFTLDKRLVFTTSAQTGRLGA